MHKRLNSHIFFSAVLVLFLLLVTACTAGQLGTQSTPEPEATYVPPTLNSRMADTAVTEEVAEAEEDTLEEIAPEAANGVSTIIIDANSAGTAVDPRIRGTNLPAWLGPDRTEDQTFIARTKAAQPTVIRIPGGSWSNGYNWLACERGTDISGNDSCGSYGWGLAPTDFINFLNEIGAEGMYTINQNGTSKEAAALVAFFNGSITDDRELGVDVQGNDWGKVSDWAKLRRDNGNPNPFGLQYWEIGNETYAGRPAFGGADCWEFGWEKVWTCDGTEYVNGTGSGVNRLEGFIEFRDMMQWVDPTIEVGAVGVPRQAGWNNWGNEVIAAAGESMDFYIVHQYGFFNTPNSLDEILALPQTDWQTIMSDVQSSINTNAPGFDIPITVTEYNLFSNQEKDNTQLMTQTVNMLFMADTMGQMMQQGFAIANQWDLANGKADNGTDYGMLDADSYARNPQYYAFPLWAKFGSTMLPVTNPLSDATQLSVYAGRVDATTISLFVINKTGDTIATNIQVDGFATITGGTADFVQGDTLGATTVSYNGNSNPADDLSDAPATTIGCSANPLAYAFPKYSISLLLLNVAEPTKSTNKIIPAGSAMNQFTYLPIAVNLEGGC